MYKKYSYTLTPIPDFLFDKKKPDKVDPLILMNVMVPTTMYLLPPFDISQ